MRYRICRRLRFTEMGRGDESEIWEAGLGGLVKEVDRARRYFAKASDLFVEAVTLLRIHRLHFCFREHHLA